MSDLPANILGTLVDPTRGVFILYPVLLVVALGAAGAWRSAPGWAKASAVTGVVAMVTQLALNRYSGGDTFFGSRLTVEGLTLAYPLLVLAWFHAPVIARRVGVPLMILSVAAHAIGAVGFPYVASGQLPGMSTYLGVGFVAVTVCLLLWRRWAQLKNTRGDDVAGKRPTQT